MENPNRSNFKLKGKDTVYPFIGTFVDEKGDTFFKTGQYTGLNSNSIELTNNREWVKVSFNMRLGYMNGKDCVNYIESIGGSGNSTTGGYWFSGSIYIISELTNYMHSKGYDTSSLSFDDCQTATKKNVDRLKNIGIIK